MKLAKMAQTKNKPSLKKLKKKKKKKAPPLKGMISSSFTLWYK